MDINQLRDEISRRRPWYQRIEFLDYGVSTTDDMENAQLSPAPDNRINGIDATLASQLRPLPKWNFIKKVLPNIEGLDILEVGCSNGFFSFKFHELGASRCLGLDIVQQQIANAEWCREVLKYEGVEFATCDYMAYPSTHAYPGGALPLFHTETFSTPHRLHDVVFSSTVWNHFFFPFFGLYKMLVMAKKFVVLDISIIPDFKNPGYNMRIESNERHWHAVLPSFEFIQTAILRLGVEKDAIRTHFYNDGQQVTIVIDTSQMVGRLRAVLKQQTP